MKEVGDQVVSGFRWMAVGRFAGQAFAWAVTIFVIRILEPADYGLMAMAMVVIGFLGIFDELGMGSAIIQQKQLDPRQVSQVFGLVILINVSAFLLLILIAPAVADFFDEPRLVPITWALAVQFPLLALQIIPDAIIRRRMEFGRKSIVNFITMVTGSLVTLAIALAGFGIWALVAGNIVTVLTRVIGFNIVARYFCKPEFNFSGMRRIVTFGTQVTAERVLWFVYSQADIFLVGRMLGKELLGFYSVAIHLASLPMTKMGEILTEISFAGFSRIQSQTDEVSRQFLKATLAISIFAFPVFFGISATAPEIVAAILGDTWTLTAVPLQILSLIIPFRMLDLVIPTALFGTGRADISVGNAVIAAVIMPISFLIGIQWGLVGVCFGWLGGYALYFIISLFRALPRLGVRFTDYLKTIAGPAIVSLVMLAVVHAARTALPNEWAMSILALGALVLTGALVFGILVWFFQRETVTFVMRLVRR
jgi:O-antigen/teichoic acid export membrane protein